MTADDRSFIFQCKLDMNGLSGFIKKKKRALPFALGGTNNHQRII